MKNTSSKKQLNSIVKAEPLYAVTITMTEGNVKGILIQEDKEIAFNPLNVLADLSYSKDKIPDAYDFINSSDYICEYAFGEVLELGKYDDNTQYAKLVMCIKDLIKKKYESRKSITLKDIEFLGQIFDISNLFLPWELVFDKNILSYNKGSYNDLIPEYISPSDMDLLVNYDLESCDNFFYQCYNLCDIVYSILHFLAFKRYKFNKCLHCERYFATLNYKIKYCSRISPYPFKENCKKLKCEPAVRNILQDLQRKHRRISDNLYKYYTKDRQDEFESEYGEIIVKVKANPTIENINECFSVLKNEKWYKKDSVRTVGEKEKQPPLK